MLVFVVGGQTNAHAEAQDSIKTLFGALCAVTSHAPDLQSSYAPIIHNHATEIRHFDITSIANHSVICSFTKPGLESREPNFNDESVLSIYDTEYLCTDVAIPTHLYSEQML